MRKSGLHKQISSIFDGVPVPPNSDLQENTEPSDELAKPQTQDAPKSANRQEAPTAPQTSGSSLVKRLTANQSDTLERDPIPVVQVGRPMPLQKSKAMSKSTKGPSFVIQVKKAVFGSQSSLDPRQKKTAMLVGILSLIFGVVLFVSLGGVGGTQVAAADTTSGDQTIQTQTAKKTAQEWKSPNPLPQDLRNATSPEMTHSDAQQEGSTAENRELIVKGILFSKNKPSAIINDQILAEGQSFSGIKLLKITKDAVEFEANEKRWTQSVQR